MILYEYVDAAGRGAMTSWARNRAMREHSWHLDQAADRLEQAGPESLPGFFVGPLAQSLVTSTSSG